MVGRPRKEKAEDWGFEPPAPAPPAPRGRTNPRPLAAPRPKTYVPTDDEILEAIDETQGLTVEMIKRWPNYCYPDLVARIERNSHLANRIRLWRENLIDRAEQVLSTHIDEGNLKAAMFTLKTLGRKRGYVERQEVQNTHHVTQGAPDLSTLSPEELQHLSTMLEKTVQAETIDAEYEDVTDVDADHD